MPGDERLSTGLDDRLRGLDTGALRGVEVRISGDEAAPRVLLVHGASANLRELWGPLAADLTHDHRVIAFDRPGYGHSSRPARGAQQLRVQARMAADVLEAAGGKAIVVGHSLGAAVSLRLAIERPELVSALVLIALAHDFRHPGRVNSARAEIEQQSFEALKPYLQQHAVPALWMERIEAVIVRSDFSVVAENHRRVAGQPFSWCTDWATVLLNEADIMASASPVFGPRLSQALAAEWELIGFEAYRSVATPEGRSAFLRSIEFSSHSAGVLGAAQRVRLQLEASLSAGPQP